MQHLIYAVSGMLELLNELSQRRCQILLIYVAPPSQLGVDKLP